MLPEKRSIKIFKIALVFYIGFVRARDKRRFPILIAV
jgi:hypothetical protein